MSERAYNIIFRGESSGAVRATEEVGEAVQSLHRNTVTYSVTFGQMGKIAETNYARMATGMHSIIRASGWLWMAWERQEVAQSILASSQDRYNRAIAQYGKNSYQATEAARELERVQNYVGRANMRVALSMATEVTQLALVLFLRKGLFVAQTANAAASTAEVGTSMTVAGAIWAKVVALKAELATRIALLSLSPAGWALLAAGTGVATGTLITYGVMTARQANVNVEINNPRSTKDVEDAMDAAKKEAVRKFRAIGGG